MSKEAVILKPKNCVLKVSIHRCEECEREVKKLLQKIEGVYWIKIDAELVQVIVERNVDPNTLLEKLQKNGKHAELWPSKDGKPQKGGKDLKGKQQQQQLPQKIEAEGKAKVTNDIDCVQWSDGRRKYLIDICLEQVKSEGRPGIQFSSKVWTKIVEKFNQRTGHGFNEEHLKNQLDYLKKLYNAWLHLKSQTGIRFNQHTGCVEMEQDRWAEYLKTHRDAKVFKSKPLPFPKEMAALFGGISTRGGDKRTPTMHECIDVLRAMPKISEVSQLYRKAVEIFEVNNDKRTIWMRFNTDEGRMLWLKDQLQ